MFNRIMAVMLLLPFFLNFFVPYAAYAQDVGDTQRKIVRVGWYDSTYNTVDEYGRRSGYAYEYQLKVAAYNGWTYEYVKGSWSDLLQMLETGQIDLMSDVSYTEEREEFMLYPELPMGTEDYYIFISPNNDMISRTDYSTLNGKKVGINRDSIQTGFFKEWAAENNIRSEVVELTCSEDESLQMLENGEVDAFVTVDSFLDPGRAVPVCKVGSSDFYFAVSKDRPDLLEDLNMALNRIQDENPYYNQQMYEKYIKRAGANTFLSGEETEWLSKHGPVRVGFQDDYMALCGTDRETGELTGVLKDYLKLASECMPDVSLQFEPVCYPTAEEAMKAMKEGQVDCVFPGNLSVYEAERQGMMMTPPILDTEMYAVVRSKEPSIFTRQKDVIAAVNEGNPNYDAFLAENYPRWKKIHYPDSKECLKAVAAGDADCLIISNYRYNNISRLCDQYRLSAFAMGVDLDYCFAVNKGETELYSILAKIIGMIPDSYVNAAVSHYITEDAKLTPKDFLIDNLTAVLIIGGIVILVILALLILNIHIANRAKRLIKATETDDLTGLYNRSFFFQYANRMYLEHPDLPMDAIVLNIEQFHSINALHGRKLGDEILSVLGREIHDLSTQHNGIAGRFEADRFDIYCQQIKDYKEVLDYLQRRLDEIAPNANIRLRMGVMLWSKNLDPVQLFDRARTACNMARGHYKEHLIIYDEKVSERESYEQRLINDLKSGLDSGEFEVYFQPKYDIRSEIPKLVSAEALVRWNHPEMGLISPGDFIPLFEKNGQISLLDKFVWTQTAKQIALWRDRYGIVIPVSVNLSRVDVFDPDLENILDGILNSNNLDHEAFKLEVTESAYTENADQVIRVVGDLRDKGYEVEMDDFGTGYSSLNMLSSMPIDVLKMDQEFIRNIEHNEKDKQLVALIIGIAKNLKVYVIAEGVETGTQLELLKNLGCMLVQGYYFSKPVPADEFERKFLKEKSSG